MMELLGIIAPLRKFLSNTEESITLLKDGREVLALHKDRVYVIPDFQREIRWDNDNVALLIDDILSGPKYLGNVILTEEEKDKYSIIDGQQRITILTMIFMAIRFLHSEDIETIIPCELKIDSFSEFTSLLKESFPEDRKSDKCVIESDKLCQVDKYYELWNYICNHEAVKDRRIACKLLNNFGQSNVNIILNKSNDVNSTIRYFVDVNLKGKQLDTEDIFKSYLFKNDQSEDVRNAWYEFKKNISKINDLGIDYSLLKVMEHYLYCEIYKDNSLKGLEFGEDFLLKKEFRSKEENTVFRKGLHIIELIQSKKYMLKTMNGINGILEIVINILKCSSNSSEFKSCFVCVKNNGTSDKIDSKELEIIHNIIGKLLKDSKVLPKALLLKYMLTTLLDKTPKVKEDYRKIYGVYLLAVLFSIFENKKNKDLIMNVLKSNDTEWYNEAVHQIESYVSQNKITDTRILAQYKLAMNEKEEDYRFRCKSLATIYNFFEVKEGKVVIRRGKTERLYKFISDDDKFSLEHLIISYNHLRSTEVVLGSSKNKYVYASDFYKKHVNCLFNFIFVPKEVNSSLSNLWLPEKLDKIDRSVVECEYSIMVMDNLVTLSNSLKAAIKNNDSLKDDLDLFFSRDYRDKFIECSRLILNNVLEHIKGK